MMKLNCFHREKLFHIFHFGLFVLALLFTLWITISSVRAEQLSGGDLLSHCASDDVISIQICHYYIGGIVDYHRLILTVENSPTVDLCIPNHVPRDVLAANVAEYLSRNSQHDDFLAAPAVIMGLFEHYPCR